MKIMLRNSTFLSSYDGTRDSTEAPCSISSPIGETLSFLR